MSPRMREEVNVLGWDEMARINSERSSFAFQVEARAAAARPDRRGGAAGETHQRSTGENCFISSCGTAEHCQPGAHFAHATHYDALGDRIPK